MPIEVIRPQLRTLRADQLSDLKREWASLAAIVERVRHAGLIRAEERAQDVQDIGSARIAAMSGRPLGLNAGLSWQETSAGDAWSP
jgi:hypothetical protein